MQNFPEKGEWKKHPKLIFIKEAIGLGTAWREGAFVTCVRLSDQSPELHKENQKYCRRNPQTAEGYSFYFSYLLLSTGYPISRIVNTHLYSKVLHKIWIKWNPQGVWTVPPEEWAWERWGEACSNPGNLRVWDSRSRVNSLSVSRTALGHVIMTPS